MQDFLLGVLLFVVYFCAASCFRYKSALDTPHSETTTTTLDATQTPDTNLSLQTHSSITPINQASNPERHINKESSFNPETEPLEPEIRTELAQEAPTDAQLPINNALHPATTVSLIKDREVIEAIWAVVEHLGFNSGRILEPAANIGLFPGFQKPEYRTNSEWVLCEIDPTAAAIARYLHPDAIVYGSSAQQRIGFEHADIPAESFDLVVSNFPFGLTSPFDPKYSRLSLSLHNYFWSKSFDLTAPGGIIAAITSVGTLDSSPEFCQYLAGQGAYLIGAVRLPNDAFRCMNTSVTADLIVLQKRKEPQSAYFWGEVVDSSVKDRYEAPLKINRYYAEHPERVLGTLSTCTLYGGGRIAVTPDAANLKQSIIDAFSFIAPCYSAPMHSKSLQQSLLPAEFIGLDPYRYCSRSGMIYQYRPGDGLCLVTEQAERIAAGLRLKAALERLVLAEINDAPNTELLRGALNQLYTQFVKKYGNLLNRRKRPSTLSVFQDDSELTTLCYALEEEIPGDVDLKTGKIKSVSYKKADIFTTRISGHLRKRDRTITTPTDALYECLERRGHLDLKFIAALLDKTESEAIALLKSVETPTGRQSLIFYDPREQRWVTRDEYLSGDTRTKLASCRIFKDTDPEQYNSFWLLDNEAQLSFRQVQKNSRSYSVNCWLMEH